jgi:hypothetical protein
MDPVRTDQIYTGALPFILIPADHDGGYTLSADGHALQETVVDTTKM